MCIRDSGTPVPRRNNIKYRQPPRHQIPLIALYVGMIKLSHTAGAGTNRPSDRFARASFYINALPQTDDVRIAIASVFSAVSYTHLDVYKRQVYQIADTLFFVLCHFKRIIITERKGSELLLPIPPPNVFKTLI